MADEDMVDADLSLWTGKSPLKPEVQLTVAEEDKDEEEEEAPVVVNMQHRNSLRSNSSSCSVDAFSSTNLATESFSGRQALDTDEDENIVDLDDSTFYIELPELDPRTLEEYEHLPGHDTAVTIISAQQMGRYYVKRGSGEKDLLTTSQIKSLHHGPTILKQFLQKTMSRPTRIIRQPGTSGMVGWDGVAVSSSDESLGSRPKRQSGRLRPQRSSDESGAEPPTSRSSSEGNPYSTTSDADSQPKRRSSRVTSKKSKSYTEIFSAIADDSDGRPRGRDRPRRNQKAPPSQRKLRESRLAQRSLRANDSKKYAKPDGARRSERTRTLLQRSMRERQEDEISAASEEDAGPRVIATREIFPKLPENHPFRQRHRPECEVCFHEGDLETKGQLVFCQGCTSSYHKSCLGNRGTREHLVTKVGDGHFILQCRRCLGRALLKDVLAPDLGACTVCHVSGPMTKPLRERMTTRQEQLQREENGGYDPITVVDPKLPNNIANVLFRCASCQRAWHLHHMPKRITADTQLDENDAEANLAEEELAQRRFDFYRRSWVCKDCVEHQSTIDRIVAWRPVDIDKYVPGCTVDMMKEIEKDYLVKWRNQSYFRTAWMPGSWVWSTCSGVSRTAFMKREQNQLPRMTTKDATPEEFFRIDIVFDVRYNSVVRNSTKEIDFARVKEVETAFIKFKGLGYDDAIWETPPRWGETERFEDFRIAYEDYVRKTYIAIPPQRTMYRHLGTIRENDFESTVMKKAQPSNVTGGEMMSYQVEGLNWLLYQWHVQKNALLADEMGLGKTIQLIAFFATLVEDHKCWPFLVVVPNSTCPNWKREIKKWAPSLLAVTYYGSSAGKKIVRDYELFPKNKDYDDQMRPKKSKESKDIKAHIVITSYESVVDSKLELLGVPWQGLVVDEGQRLKNDKGLLYEVLGKFRFPFKVLLTGTPLQNNVRELFNLLAFIDRTLNASQLEEKFATLTDENVPEVHAMIRPYFLRRTKAEVLTFLPPMAQIILPVTMSAVQKKVYKSVLAKNPDLMKSIFSREAVTANQRANLNNILMQLRKTLCHPFVYSREIEERGLPHIAMHRNLVEASSKLQLLSIMLPKLHERGHRVLIFSQFLNNLDILEDFLDGLGLQHRRLDGGMTSLEKQKRIDEFNAPESPFFAFLLSTRAGGVGINLATADTVLIMDPDFNPHQDIQALSRAHRIGQKNKVLVFQVMTRDSAEEKIMQIAKKRMALDHVLIQAMDQQDDAGTNLEAILRYGAEALFNDTDGDGIVYDSASVDKLLDRSTIEATSAGEDKSAESQFSFARVWQNDKATLEDGVQDSETNTPLNPGVWDQILIEREGAYKEEAARKAEQLGRGKRKRHNVDYVSQAGEPNSQQLPQIKKIFGKRDKKIASGSDTDFQAASESDEEDEYDEGTEADPANGVLLGSDIAGSQQPLRVIQQPTVKARPFQRVRVPQGHAPHFNGDGPVDGIPLDSMPPLHNCSACNEIHPMGWCRLKLAGVEYCGLCGLAHVGHGRTCPHLNSETQVTTLLETLKESTEPREMIELAQKYLRMIRGDLVQRKRKQESKQQEAARKAQLLDTKSEVNLPSG